MATIIKRKKSYSVVYNFEDETGETRQKWETWHTHKDALRRKAEVESQQFNGIFVVPKEQTVEEYLYDFVSLYGEKNWGVSTYDGNTGLIANYINPLIGHVKMQDINAHFVDKFYKQLQKTPAASSSRRKATTQYIAPGATEKVFRLLRCAFKQAVKWELIGKNPFEHFDLPRRKYPKREIWDAEMIKTALDNCEDTKLYIALNLAFACSLRMGEILGLTWDNIHISDDDLSRDDAYVYVDKELERASRRSIEVLEKKDIYFIFPTLYPNTSTQIVLKKPKTDSSIRKVWLPKTVAYILRKHKEAQSELKDFLGSDYIDYNLVVAQTNGRPCEGRIILKELHSLREKTGLPEVVFHSLRHSSTTYKLKLNHGDIKATQGDTGHAEIDMITKVYAHILDEDRKINAQKFEAAFYSNPDLRNVKPPEEKLQVDLGALIEQLKSSPELAQTLAAIIQNNK